jgi:hypothetical protein
MRAKVANDAVELFGALSYEASVLPGFVKTGELVFESHSFFEREG